MVLHFTWSYFRVVKWTKKDSTWLYVPAMWPRAQQDSTCPGLKTSGLPTQSFASQTDLRAQTSWQASGC